MIRAIGPAVLTALALVLQFPTVASANGEGRVNGYVFTENLKPLPGVRVVLKGATVAETDGDGYFTFEVQSGAYPLTFKKEGLTPISSAPVRVEPGVTTELLLVYRDGSPEFEIEQPEGSAVEGIDEDNLPRQTVTGVVTGPDGRPVDGARIIVRGTSVDARTNPDGSFSIEVPVGERQITFIHPDYATGNVPVTVAQDAPPEPVELTLESRAATLAELVVTVPELEGGTVFVLKERQESSNVAEILGADQISKAGDSDAASALARVTGITIVGGRYVYVRGLGERYSSTMLNGSSLPSTSPEKRVVPLDLFPAGIISAIEVQKNYSPDLPAEFGGGVVKIKTKDIPEDFQFTLNASAGALTGTTLQSGQLGAPGSSTDWLGFGAAARNLPFQDLAETTLIRRSTVTSEFLSPTELEDLGEQFQTSFALDNNRTIPIDFGFGGDIGGKLSLGKESRLGALIGFDLGNSFQLKDDFEAATFGINNETGELTPFTDNEGVLNEREVTLTTIGTFGYDINKHNELRLTSSVNRISFEELSVTEGFGNENVQRATSNHWIEEMLFTNQVRGHHDILPLGGAELDYRYQFSLAVRDEPDRRRIREQLDPNTDEFLFLTQDGNNRFFSYLEDFGHDAGLDWKQPFKAFGGLESNVQAGVAGVYKERDVTVRRFLFDATRFDDQQLLFGVSGGGLDQIFTPDTIASDRFELVEITQAFDNYQGTTRILAGYLMTDLSVLSNLKFQVGARVEDGRQQVDTVDPISRELAQNLPNDADPTAILQTLDVLPAVSATWEFIKDMQLRLAFARTVNRPTLRELSRATILDITTGRQFEGNPDLKRALISHLDLRWEWYPSPGESVSFAAYGKLFENPIEITARDGAALTFRPQNIDSGLSGGLEFEFRKNFLFLGETFEPFYAAGNFALIGSTVNLGSAAGVLTSQERALQGQSPYSVNFQLGYENLDSDTNITLLFNVFGPRISSVSIRGVPDVYEQPVPRLDIVASQRFGRFKFGIKAQNLINPRVRFTQIEPATGDELIFEAYTPGIKVSLGASVDLD